MFYSIEKYLFYYGEHSYLSFNTLPLNIKPIKMRGYDGGFSFWIYNSKEDVLSMALSENRAITDKNEIIYIKEICGYYYNENDIIVELYDVNNYKYFVELYTDPFALNGVAFDISKPYELSEDFSHIELQDNRFFQVRRFILIILFVTIMNILIISALTKGMRWRILPHLKNNIKSTLSQNIRKINTLLIMALICFYFILPLFIIPSFISDNNKIFASLVLLILAIILQFLNVVFANITYKYFKTKSNKTNLRFYYGLLMSLFMLPVAISLFFVGISFILSIYLWV